VVSRLGCCGYVASWRNWATVLCSKRTLCLPPTYSNSLHLLSVTLQRVQCKSTIEVFWMSFGAAVETSALSYRHASDSFQAFFPMDSMAKFLDYFRKHLWDREVVLLVDEFSDLDNACQDILDETLGAFRTFKHGAQQYAVRCVIAAGTYSIINFTPSVGFSPFNIANVIQTPYFTIEDTRELFHEFEEVVGTSIDDAIVNDIWAKSSG
jgi:hypothetical protein